MKYTEIKPLNSDQVNEALRHGSINEKINALHSLSLHSDGYQFAQDKCLAYVDSDNLDLAKCAIACLGTIARVHKKLDKSVVVAKLNQIKNNAKLSGVVEDTLDDIDIYVH